MDIDHDKGTNLSPAERARAMSQALADAARRVRLARYKTSLSGGGFQARRGQRAMRIFVIVSFLLLVAIPISCSAIYYGILASDQYAVEAQFTVMGGEVQATKDGFGAAAGIPLLAIIQDTQIVANYITSRAMVEELEKAANLRAAYESPSIDWFARLRPGQPIEKVVRYWKKMVSSSISMPSGIVEVEVKAFTPESAARIGKAIIGISEKLVNDLNARTTADMVKSTQIELERASERLAKARINLEQARNDEGILDATGAANLLNKLITEAKASLLSLQQERATQLKYVQETSPQMRVLSSRIDATRSQIQELEAKLTTTKTTNNAQVALSSSMTKFAALDLERQIAERLYAGSAAALEIARIAAERKAMYLNTFVWPVEPEYPLYPKRALMFVLIVLVVTGVWGILVGLVALARNHMA
ncbi:lipopolysaccharide biosynthesis protein [Methylocella sp. CPCC 101449]|uniref:lipopolysaccharide biosynthesis protein n=1 Tax=Methylocella sp. CPCC 101449 TaxID=2987531 RepID=UPI00288DE721|nr:lipopolysaccharide biosynthesis protein [Methylocella sp. CPCC 101449]MDT2019464.1 lipopolysaccharide biosynthesis protein [Methylocella sp. CPCC 101449]